MSHQLALDLHAESRLDRRFRAWDAANPEVYRLFERFSLQAARSGRRIGAKAIVERMRWELRVETRGDDFKLNNSYVSRLARKFVERHPEHAELFELRELRA